MKCLVWNLVWIFRCRGLIDMRIIMYVWDMETYMNLLDRANRSSFFEYSSASFYQDQFLNARKSITSLIKRSYGEETVKEYLNIPYGDIDAQEKFIDTIINKKIKRFFSEKRS